MGRDRAGSGLGRASLPDSAQQGCLPKATFPLSSLALPLDPGSASSKEPVPCLNPAFCHCSMSSLSTHGHRAATCLDTENSHQEVQPDLAVPPRTTGTGGGIAKKGGDKERCGGGERTSMKKMPELDRSQLQLLEHQPSGLRVELSLESVVILCGRKPFHCWPWCDGCGP